MKRVKIEHASKNLDTLIDEVTESEEPILIQAKRTSSVLVSEQNCISIQETLYLLSIPKMRESLKGGINEPIEQCSKEPGW
ncbi:MAG: type II toxin-antitoxin system prevent-host-death family antitoxin [Candidatus Dadabacteria bacterium]|nr:type II toxin-antitoxin system prevent-host-death family antitoxin [Candidatus Dadabacteria bacterium]NIS09031.1 type II toxin-antitoxin system prevent-host-death family antitoxin [Candidatus Dadabacteria bacterium]NIX15625.1 type II toxin-antitoxin system prevent-host-death family antitoxin [Candidatus Dadabacteria bacterium]NIY22367.1 type II toxin-antitoxin system prevent-host-death family antitoxin [Candidatus Dadabacteria bacterium]